MSAPRVSASLAAALAAGAALLGCSPLEPHRCRAETSRSEAPIAVTHFHGDAHRTGWAPTENQLTADAVRQRGLARAWRSPPLDAAVLDGVRYPPLIYAAPLYLDDVVVSTSTLAEVALDLAFVVTSNGWLYAIATGADAACGVARGDIVYRRQLVTPQPIERLDGGVPMGILSTPVIDRMAGRIYVAAHDAILGWSVFALDLTTGATVPGWPVTIDDTALAPVNRNGPARFLAPEHMSQRGALQLSPSGDRVYVAFGTYWGTGVGWLVAVDTEGVRIADAFSSAPETEAISSGGIWGSAGPAIAEDGSVWATTGNAPGSGQAPSTWGSSLLELSAELELERIYTPFNWCVLDERNMDLGASQPLLLTLDGTTTPNVAAFGGKQGVVYLVDRDAMSPPGPARPACRDDAASDASLFGPDMQPAFGSPGPLSVFGPYSDEFGEIDHAKMRTKLAVYQRPGETYLFASGTTKASEESTDNVAPSLVRLRVATRDDGAAYLAIDGDNPDVVMHNPGSPVVSGQDDAVVWVLDRNAPRLAPLLDPATPGPVLYAFDAATLDLLWQSSPLSPSGKYHHPVVVHGHVLVATDRLEAFALAE
ncbi:MAG: hypothetical protein RIF41_38935 [Polyangiaceae bacterium]